jgi:ribosomal protein S18 acetylase RimI-like enzyme
VCGLTVPWNDPALDFDRALANPTSGILGGFAERRLIASAMYGYEGHRGWLYYVAVAPDIRRQGLARQIVTAAEDRLKALGAVKVMLMVRGGNSAAQALYETLGYAVSDVTTYGKFF